ncbi:hypothetical protein MBEHAL_1362 [Halarchaeum acidiphilum MH1-52-1]|uniref:Alpha-1 4-glucan-protein synthase n=1 Tax=Halarchaeum acidiphilum MH1-52-1 TaxID=1261545 RepID=U2YUZ4_9EURY|nr:hypothetical protein [Halarchaeum acidiphilum]GAD52602.1 hypothetical protein MBEHAL_1362 [Halarchaeum acidiphilum MH1-52-1]
MSDPDVCVVVPTIREYGCVRDYVANARAHGFDTDRLEFCLVTEDDCPTGEMRAMLDDLGVAGGVYDGSARDRWFESHGIAEHRDLIPARSHAQTSFGLLYLWAAGHDYGAFLDDDTRPHEGVDFFGTHLANLAYEGDLVERASDERWVNVLDDAEGDLYPRGYPYAAMDETVERRTTEVSDVVASQGLWTDVPDLDAVRILNDGDLRGQAATRTSSADFPTDFVAARGHYLTVCSMNLAFRREVVPAFYQFPMDDNEWGVGRFDDIWSGLLLKRACDAVGTRLYNGRPLCRHEKAPRSTFDDLADEVAGLELNEHVWEVIDRAEPTLPDGDASGDPLAADGGARVDAYAAVARAVADELVAGDFSTYRNGAFLNRCGERLREWLSCLDALADGGTFRQL